MLKKYYIKVEKDYFHVMALLGNLFSLLCSDTSNEEITGHQYLGGNLPGIGAQLSPHFLCPSKEGRTDVRAKLLQGSSTFLPVCMHLLLYVILLQHATSLTWFCSDIS